MVDCPIDLGYFDENDMMILRLYKICTDHLQNLRQPAFFILFPQKPDPQVVLYLFIRQRRQFFLSFLFCLVCNFYL